MKDIMLDLETMGNGPQAAIIAIGAVEFDIPNRLLGEMFYTVVDLKSSIEMGGIVDASTIMWWMGQSNEARQAVCLDGIHISKVLMDFSNWISSLGAPFDDIRVWGNGAVFDNVILTSAYKRSGLNRPWSYRGDMCYRTMRAMYPKIEIPKEGTHHNALDDSIYQAKYLIEIMNRFGNKEIF